MLKALEHVNESEFLMYIRDEFLRWRWKSNFVMHHPLCGGEHLINTYYWTSLLGRSVVDVGFFDGRSII